MHKLKTSKRERSDANPLSIFGPVGFIIIVVAVIMGIFVLKEYFTPVQYHIQVNTSPQGAEVLLLNREPLKTPCDFYIKTSDKVVNFVIQKDSYETLEESILLEKKDTILNYKLNEVRSEETVSMPMVPINKGLPSPAVYKIEESQDGALYLLLENGIVFSQNGKDFTVLYRGSPSDFTITPNGIFIVEGNSKLILLNSKGQNKIAPTPFSLARALYYSEKNNTLFIGCQSGLYSYNPESRQFIQLYKNIVGITKLYLSSKYLYIFANEYTNTPYLINLYRYDIETNKLSTVKRKIDAAFIGRNKLFIAMHRGNDVEILSSVEDTNRFASVGMIMDIPPDLNHLYVL
ncbi:MAG: PEGA domain-containing protein, partial [Caldiserica bacterium]|nr:PEGA domain-containing protein [Caldisericota bacterium]